jgi:hypothetical protein
MLSPTNKVDTSTYKIQAVASKCFKHKAQVRCLQHVPLNKRCVFNYITQDEFVVLEISDFYARYLKPTLADVSQPG